MNDVSDAELLSVIKDFLEMGHVDNIVAMFDRDPRYFKWTGDILQDERFAVLRRPIHARGGAERAGHYQRAEPA